MPFRVQALKDLGCGLLSVCGLDRSLLIIFWYLFEFGLNSTLRLCRLCWLRGCGFALRYIGTTQGLGCALLLHFSRVQRRAA